MERRCRYLRRQLQPRGGQHVGDEPFQLGEVAGDLSERSGGLLRVSFGGQIESDANPGQRRAQLVRDGRSEAGAQLLVRSEVSRLTEVDEELPPPVELERHASRAPRFGPQELVRDRASDLETSE